jgi:putative DNA primase/helicase
MGLIYGFQGQRNFKLRSESNESIVEFLGLGNQMVLPPSKHPSTGKPYTANANLWEVLDKVQMMPMNVEQLLREALDDVLGGKGFSLAPSTRSKPLDVVPEGERDIQMIRHAGYLARVVLGIDRSAQLSLQKAIDHMVVWVTDFTSRVSGDDMDPGKGVSKLLEFLLKDVSAGRTLPNGWDDELSEVWREDAVVQALFEKNKV